MPGPKTKKILASTKKPAFTVVSKKPLLVSKKPASTVVSKKPPSSIKLSNSVTTASKQLLGEKGDGQIVVQMQAVITMKDHKIQNMSMTGLAFASSSTQKVSGKSTMLLNM